MLRAIGAFKWQIGLLVVSEGLILALIGAVLGTPLGWAWIKLLSIQFDHLFAAGVHIDIPGILLGAGGVMVAALLGSFLPAWWAMRVDPLAAMSPLAAPAATNRRLPWRSAVVGLFFAALDPILFHGPLHWLVHWAMTDRVFPVGASVGLAGRAFCRPIGRGIVRHPFRTFTTTTDRRHLAGRRHLRSADGRAGHPRGNADSEQQPPERMEIARPFSRHLHLQHHRP
jgi:predicted lysophospholipase L1 biosynthesis ABC-type transport system permease subunit